MEQFVTQLQAEASGILLAIGSAASSALIVFVGLYGLTLMVRSFKLDGSQMASPENYERDAWEAGIHGPFGPDPSNEGDIRNHYQGYGPNGEKIGPTDD